MNKYSLEEGQARIVDAIIETYCCVMGKEKWNSLTAVQQHAVIMTIVHDMRDALNGGEK